ncbi:MAG: hypothetical protein JST30_12095 [Armatimonadetes bacterium]|nr:hypothetical protein [Armatimonadota bacterium]
MKTNVVAAMAVLLCLNVGAVRAQGGGMAGGGFGGSQVGGGRGGQGHLADVLANTDATVARYLDGEETKSILTPGEFTEWNLDLKAGDVVIVEARSDFFDPAIEIVDDKDKVLAFNDDRYPGDQRPLLLWQCEKDGAYRIHGRCFRDKAGGQMFLRYRTYKSVDVALGGTSQYDLAGNDRFLTRVSLKAGQIIQIDDVGGGREGHTAFSPDIVIAPTGVPNPVFLEDFQSVMRQAVFAPLDGAYYLFCSTHGQTQGKVRVGATEIVPKDLERTGTAGKSGAETGKRGLWKLSLKAGEFLRFETPELRPETTIVVAPAPKIAAFDPKKPETSPFNPKPSDPAAPQSLLEMEGRYQDGRISVVRVLQNSDVWVAVDPAKKDRDQYTLTVDRAASDFVAGPSHGAPLKIGGNGYWEFDGSVGEVVTVKTEAVSFAQEVVLYGPDGQPVWTRSVGVDEQRIEQTVVVTRPGRYVLAVSAQGDGGSGEYRLERSVAAVKPFSKSAAAKGDTGKGIQVWKFTLKPNDPALLHWTTSNWEYEILVCDAAGNKIGLPLTSVDATNAYSLLSTDKPREYVIVLVPRGTKGSTYSISLENLPGLKGGG